MYRTHLELLNQISDHQMVFTLVENLSYVTEIPKFIDIECNDPRSMQAFITELENINILTNWNKQLIVIHKKIIIALLRY